MMEGGNFAMYRERLIDHIGLERVERIENMARANQGSVKALSMLSEEDAWKAVRKRTATYYREILDATKAEVRKLQKEK